MNSQRTPCLGLCVSIASILGVCGQAAGFSPQSEPPGMPRDWHVEGHVEAAAAAGDPRVISDGAIDFSAGVIGRFDAPSTADNKPVDASAGVATGGMGTTAVTAPGRSDESSELPASAGTPQGADKRDGDNVGTATETHALADGVIPEPTTLIVLGVAAGLVLKRRRTK